MRQSRLIPLFQSELDSFGSPILTELPIAKYDEVRIITPPLRTGDRNKTFSEKEIFNAKKRYLFTGDLLI